MSKATQEAGEESQQEKRLIAEIGGWNPFLQHAKGQYESIADFFQKAEKNGAREVNGTVANLSLQLSDDSFKLADSDDSQGLSFKELQDYAHLALELVGMLKLGGPLFDGWNMGDWSCLNLKMSSRVSPPSCHQVSRE